MKRVGIFTVCAILRCNSKKPPPLQKQKQSKTSPDIPLDEARTRELESEAEQRGFMRRDNPDAKVYMEEHLTRPELISGGVMVANLPPIPREETEFDVYQRSTRDFTSQVTPYGTTGVGLGAGFGAKEDKRLGFLRPRKLQPFAGDHSIIPKYDENGMPIDADLTKEQLIRKRMAYMKSFEGTTMSHREHFLLVDLDFEKDAMIFGNTRAEFEKNVTKLKEVISTYTKWERTDNFYYYGTIVLKILTVWVLMECLQQYYELQLLSGHYDDFVESMEETMNGLETNLQRDLKRAREELEVHRPDFSPVVEAIRREKRRLLDTEEAKKKKEQQEEKEQQEKKKKNTVNNDIIDNKENINSNITAKIEEVVRSQSIEEIVNQQSKQISVEKLILKDNILQHPMDTTNEQAYLASLEQREREYEMRRLQESAASSSATYSVLAAIWRKIRGNSGRDDAILTPLQQEDFARLSYAASPTSIETLRAIRRILLPRSEDYIQVVREEMLEYKKEKEARLIHPE